jgi:hypothetical protein
MVMKFIQKVFLAKYLIEVTSINASVYGIEGVKELSGSIKGDGGCSPFSRDCA